MGFSNWLRAGAVGVLGALSPGCDWKSDDNAGIVQPAQYFFKVPQLSDLERKISAFSPETGSKEELLKQADYGERFHQSFSLFVANYTLGGSSDWWGYRFEHRGKVESWVVEKLKSNALVIRHNGENNSEYTLRRCDAAEELYGIMKKAEKEGHLNEVAKVVGYLDRASSRTQSIFSRFKFFYENASADKSPKDAWRYWDDVRVIRDMEIRAERLFSSLSENVRNELAGWVGCYGYDGLRQSFPEIPTAPTSRKDEFYERLGKDLLKGYGLSTDS